MISQKNKPVREEGSRKWSFQRVFLAGFSGHNDQSGVINPQQLRIWEAAAEKLVCVRALGLNNWILPMVGSENIPV